MNSSDYLPGRYALYTAFAGRAAALHNSDLTADMIRQHAGRAAGGAVIVGPEIRDNPARFGEYEALRALTVGTVANWRNSAQHFQHPARPGTGARGYSAATVSRMLTECKRHLVIDLGLSDHPAVALLELDSGDAGAIKQRGAARANRTAKLRRPFYDVAGIISTARKLAASRSYLKIIAGLVLLTGRRPGEIVITAQFKRTGEYSAIFTGQLKTEKDARLTGKSGGNDRDAYEIPLLAPFGEIQSALDRLRNNPRLQKIIADMEAATGPMTLPQVVNSRLASNCRDMARGAFLYRIPDFIDGAGTVARPMRQMSTYTLRGVYAKICAMNAGLTDETDVSYIREILGHAYGNLSTSAAYDHCYYAGPKLPGGTVVKKAGVNLDGMELKGLDIAAIQNAGSAGGVEPVRLADLYKPAKSKPAKSGGILEAARAFLGRLAFWK